MLPFGIKSIDSWRRCRRGRAALHDSLPQGFGIEIMRLAATLAELLAPKQMSPSLTSLTEEPEVDVSDLIDTLANRVGEQHLYRFAPVASDVPERSVQKIAPAAPNTGEARGVRRRVKCTDGPKRMFGNGGSGTPS